MMKNRKILGGLGGLLLCLLITFFSLKPIARPKVYDCILFFNEFELLNIRLHEMAPEVDYFVIVEATETFRGVPKPLILEKNKELFAEFADKIIYIPFVTHLETQSAWERERFQRAQVLQGLKRCNDQDIVLLSDLDEIVRRSCLPKIKALLSSNKTQAVVCKQKMYYGYLNRYWYEWSGTVATHYKTAKKIGIQQLRKVRNQRPRTLKRNGLTHTTLLPDAGWHFTFMGGKERFVQKTQAYSHSEFDRPELKTDAYFSSAVDGKILVKIDDTFPQFVQDNHTYLEKIGFIDTRSE